MNVLTLVAVVVGIVVFIIVWFVDSAFDKLIDKLFTMLGLQSGGGPLIVKAAIEGGTIVLALENQGKHTFRVAGLAGRDGNRTKCFPTPYLNENDFDLPGAEKRVRKQFAKLSLGPGETKTVILNKSELIAMDCQTLTVLDTKGRAWPVEDLNAKAVRD